MKISQEFKEKVSVAIGEWIAENPKDNTQLALSQKTGVNNGAISSIKRGLFINGKTPYPDADYLEIAKFLCPNLLEVNENDDSTESNEVLKLRLKALVGKTHFNTSNFGETMKMVEDAMKYNLQGVLDSAISRAGKTYSLEIASKLWVKGVKYYKATGEVTPKEFLNGILESMGIKDFKGNNAAKIDEIGRKMGKNTVLILDEMETVKRKNTVYPILKDLIDSSKKNDFGLIVVGHGLLNFLEKKAKKGMGNYPQIMGRLNRNLTLSEITKEDVSKIAAQFGGLQEDTKHWIFEHIGNYDMLQKWILPIQAIDSKLSGKNLLSKLNDKFINTKRRATPDTMDRFSI